MRITLAVAVACLTICGVAAADNASAAIRKTTNIPVEGLGPALTTLAKEFDFQVLYRTEAVGTLRTQGAVGEFTPDEALKQLLSGTGLTYRYLDDKTVTIMPVGEASSSPSSGGGHDAAQSEEAEKGNQSQGGDQKKKSFWDRFRLAQATPSSNSGLSPQSSALGTQLAQANTVPTGPEVKKQQQQPGQIEEIIVTAQRRSERLQDVPVSVAAYDQKDITRLAISGIEDLMRFTPGLDVGGYSTSFAPIISIRGIIPTGGGSSPTGIYIDDTPIQFRQIGNNQDGTTAFPTVFDLERIEVLRGPQGTLFGGGSEGGAVRFITPDPSFTANTGHARAEFGFNGLGAPSYQLGGAVGGPLLPDRLAFRVSAYVQEDGGWIDRRPYPATIVADKNANWVRTATLNAALAWAITDNLTVTPKVFYQNLTTGGSPFYWRGVSNPSSEDFVTGLLTNQNTLDQFTLPSLKVEWRAGNVATLISNTSYMDRTRNFTSDNTFLWTEVFGGDINTTPNAFSPGYSKNPQRQFTQEIRLQSNDSNSALRWVVGAFYQTLDNRGIATYLSPDIGQVTQALFGLTVAQTFGGIPLLPGGVIYASYDATRDTQKAGFGQVDIRLFDKLTATAGLRYSKMGFRYTNAQDGPFNGGPPPTGFSGSSGDSSASFTTPKFGLEYQPTEGLMFYASAAKGFRPGAANTPFPVAGCAGDLHKFGINSPPLSYDPDYVWSYEVGSKGELLKHRLLWDVSVYHIDWKAIQTNLYLPACGQSLNVNVGAAISEGFDLHTRYAVTEHLTIEGSFGYDKDQISKTLAYPGAANNIATKGDPLGAPPWHGFVSADYEFTPLPNKTRMYIHADDSYTSHLGARSPLDGVNPIIGALGLDVQFAINVMSARIGIRGESWDASLFTKNLLNSHPIEGAFGPYQTNSLTTIGELTLPPRVVGITGTYKF